MCILSANKLGDLRALETLALASVLPQFSYLCGSRGNLKSGWESDLLLVQFSAAQRLCIITKVCIVNQRLLDLFEGSQLLMLATETLERHN